jgi:hypothetical protein
VEKRVMDEERAPFSGAKQWPFTLALDSDGQVIAIKGDERILLGPVDAACAEMWRFFAEVAFDTPWKDDGALDAEDERAEIALATAGTWPELPSIGYMSGRVARDDDAARGDAVFVAYPAEEPPPVTPAPVTIPQFAYLTRPGGYRLPLVVVQAEITPDGTYYGLRDIHGEGYTGRDDTVELLGPTHP